MDSKQAREQIFRHLDGIVTIPVTISLHKKGILEHLQQHQSCTLSSLNDRFQANKGYLNVALRTLASQGFLDYEVNNEQEEIIISTNDRTKSFIELIEWYQLLSPILTSYDVEDFMGKNAQSNHAIFAVFASVLSKKKGKNVSEDSIEFQLMKHVEGYLLGPIIVKLGMSGMFHKYFMESSFSAEEFHQNPAIFTQILDFLTENGWFTKLHDHYQFTEQGLFYAKRAAAYGVTVSYLPIFLNMDDMLFGKAGKLRDDQTQVDEIHVDRAMNVWGSGGAHATYFKVLDDFIIDIFNQPLEQQPKGILDMGCGNGALLHHLYETIERSTLRGKHLDDYPLFLVGADYNQAALKITRANLIASDIWAKVIWGDIGNPQKLADDLKRNYNIELEDLINMRTFLDHNRVWEEPKNESELISTSTGAFAHRGQWISNNEVEQSLVEHLQKWKPFISKNGLFLIELHTVNPAITSKNIGRTPATAYDATHGFSDQYIVEIESFHNAAKQAGMTIDNKLFKKFPNTDYATVSINYLK